MSSTLQNVLEILQWNNYTSLLVFAREVNYVWHRPWTWVSTLFVVIRYIGLSYTM
ncbi:hypothetical protein V8E55_009686 [Tylopilus felleus]